MPNTTPKNKLLFDFYQNIKSGTEVLSVEDLEVAIKTMELAKEQLKVKEQQRIVEASLKAPTPPPNGKVLYLPKNQKTLYANAFKGNEEIVKVVLNEGLKEIGEYAFAGCTNLSEVVFPNNRIRLRKGCFKDCISLKEVYIPRTRVIGPSAFENCTALEKVSLPGEAAYIYTKVFKNCRSLKEVLFTKKDISYDEGGSLFADVFANCTSLEKVDIPKCFCVDNMAFYRCDNLQEIHFCHARYRVEGRGRRFHYCNAKVTYEDE